MHEVPEIQPGSEEQPETVRSTFDEMPLRDLIALGIEHLDAADEARKLGKDGEGEARNHDAAAGKINGILDNKHKTMLGHQITLDMDTLKRKSRLEE